MRIAGTGLLTGAPAEAILRPAGTDEGIAFVKDNVRIAAHVTNLAHLGPRIVTLRRENVTVPGVEHLLAALHGRGITNVTVNVREPEVPAGPVISAGLYVAALDRAGRVAQRKPASAVAIAPGFRYAEGGSRAYSLPDAALMAERGLLRLSIRVAFPLPVGEHRVSLILSDRTPLRDVFEARSFMGSAVDCRWPDGRSSWELIRSDLSGLPDLGTGGLITYWKSGHWLDGPADVQEPARHKLLDLIGDLALLGHVPVGSLAVELPGHRFNSKACSAILEASGRFAAAGAAAGS